ncbi:restriction endonuclease subunit S [Helicobacter sp. MIT 01-3238]|uniref:restriction endonuclease subunit S n=1 Tax=Helicobacter sp. MIT 01-3238 TaxID=398627 RepID=UPI000E1E9C28|nr:restriction endonuclease subunit S [Helicobacter sp. MIT 01-3238]RDU51534.1 hypothetical protein CQA40_09790 [Helicobacter sp. MIT 01-3238]
MSEKHKNKNPIPCQSDSTKSPISCEVESQISPLVRKTKSKLSHLVREAESKSPLTCESDSIKSPLPCGGGLGVGIIPQGYKQTSIGTIPQDWEVVRLGEVCDFLKGKGISKENLTENGIPCIRYGELYTTYKEIIWKVISKTNLDSSELVFSKANDIILPTSGETTIDICKASCIMLNNVALGGDLNILRSKQNGAFLSYYINHIAKYNIAKLAQGVSIVHLYASELKSLQIPLPPLKEQEKIARILSVWDSAIDSLANLIKAKRKYKTALMQRLLTPPKDKSTHPLAPSAREGEQEVSHRTNEGESHQSSLRFAGFSDKWQEFRLGDLLKEKNTRNANNVNLVLSVTNKQGFVAQKDYFEQEVASNDTSNYKVVCRGEFAYNPARINVGSIAMLENFENGILSPMYIVFECLEKINKDFFKYWLESHNFRGVLGRYLSGSVRETLSFNDMKTMKIFIPTLAEQKRIAQVLSVCDKEIETLNLKFECLKAQKRGLMQQLLSGKVRVKC